MNIGIQRALSFKRLVDTFIKENIVIFFSNLIRCVKFFNGRKNISVARWEKFLYELNAIVRIQRVHCLGHL